MTEVERIQAELAFEKRIRAMRDRVFGHTSSDKNWAASSWLRPDGVAWLESEAVKMGKREAEL